MYKLRCVAICLVEMELPKKKYSLLLKIFGSMRHECTYAYMVASSCAHASCYRPLINIFYCRKGLPKLKLNS